MLKFSFVIPNFNRYDLVHTLLFDIYKTCLPMHEVIVVNDGCTQMESFTGVEWWSRGTMLPVHELRLEENVGFLRASNAGMKYATGDIICLVSNDVRVKADIVLRIEHFLKGNPHSLVGGRLIDWNSGWNKFDDVMFPYIEGWLLAMTRMGWEEMDYFDEQFSPNDFEDVDLSTKVLSHDGLLLPLSEDMTYHMGAQSIKYSPERQKLTEINREKFREKWMKH